MNISLIWNGVIAFLVSLCFTAGVFAATPEEAATAIDWPCRGRVILKTIFAKFTGR